MHYFPNGIGPVDSELCALWDEVKPIGTKMSDYYRVIREIDRFKTTQDVILLKLWCAIGVIGGGFKPDLRIHTFEEVLKNFDVDFDLDQIKNIFLGLVNNHPQITRVVDFAHILRKHAFWDFSALLYKSIIARDAFMPNNYLEHLAKNITICERACLVVKTNKLPENVQINSRTDHSELVNKNNIINPLLFFSEIKPSSFYGEEKDPSQYSMWSNISEKS